MISFVVGLLTVLLLIVSLLLGLLVLVQLPKKEAGVGMAFGGGAADALFGAGSGTALTNLTKYTSIAFFVFVILLSVAKNHQYHSGMSNLKEQFEKQSAAPAESQGGPAFPMVTPTNSSAPASTSTTPMPAPAAAAASSNSPATPAK